MERNEGLASIWLNSQDFIAHKRLNQAADEINHLHKTNATTEQQVLRLLELDRDQGQQIAKLQAVVYVLMQMMTEKGQIDGVEMNRRIGEAFKQLESDPSWNRMRGV